MAIDGELRHFGISSLVQVICNEAQDALLLLWDRNRAGKIFFSSGMIVHATTGSCRGEEAVYELMTWTGGTFRLTDLSGDCPRTIERPPSQLVLEAMTRQDERRRDEAVRGEDPGRTAEDGSIQDRIFALLSRLEQEMGPLADAKMRKRPVNALAAVAQLVNEASSAAKAAGIAGFSDLEDVVGRMCDVHPQLELVDVRNGRLSTESLAKAYSAWSWTDQRRERFFRRVGDDLVALLEAHVHALAAPLLSPGARADALEASRSLFLELRRLLETIPL